MLRTIYIVVSAMLIASCGTHSPVDDVPAVIDHPTPASHGELVGIVSNVLGQSPVMLSHDVLTRTNLLTIEMKRIQQIEGERDGRRMNETPFQFRLVVNKSDCVLIFSRDQSRFRLKDTSCREQN
jgi:hypothetical protein